MAFHFPTNLSILLLSFFFTSIVPGSPLIVLVELLEF